MQQNNPNKWKNGPQKQEESGLGLADMTVKFLTMTAEYIQESYGTTSPPTQIHRPTNQQPQNHNQSTNHGNQQRSYNQKNQGSGARPNTNPPKQPSSGVVHVRDDFSTGKAQVVQNFVTKNIYVTPNTSQLQPNNGAIRKNFNNGNVQKGNPNGPTGNQSRPQQNYQNRPQQNCQNKPQQNYQNKPQQNYQNKPQQNYQNKPQQNNQNKPQQNYQNKPQQNYQNRPQQNCQNKPQQNYQNKPQQNNQNKPQQNNQNNGSKKNQNGSKNKTTSLEETLIKQLLKDKKGGSGKGETIIIIKK